MTSANNADLRSSVLAALAFFDVFDYPLTFSEIKRLRYGRSGASAASAEIAAVLASAAEERDGYYFLPGRSVIVDTRHRRYRLAERKFLKARRLAKWARLLPSVRLVAVCNSLALSNADTESDIDIFIICRPGTLWVTRLLLAGTLQLLGLRPRPGRHADTFCLSFFLSEDDLDISRLALPSGDTYLLYWIASLVPLYDAGGVMSSFMAANSWVRVFLPGLFGQETGSIRRSPAAQGWNSWLLRPLSLLEPAARRFQERRFPPEISSLANIDSRVVVTDNVLKFHVADRRAYFEDIFHERLAGLGLTV